MIERGMTYEQVLEMVEANGWEVLKNVPMEEYGETWRELTIWQDDHAVGVGVDDDGVYELVYIPRWAL